MLHCDLTAGWFGRQITPYFRLAGKRSNSILDGIPVELELVLLGDSMALEILVCILLHLSVMTAPGTYSLSEIEVFESDNATEINAVHADPALEQSVVQTYTPQLEFIEIWDVDSWD